MHLMYKKAKEKGLRIDREDLVKQAATWSSIGASTSGSTRSANT